MFESLRAKTTLIALLGGIFLLLMGPLSGADKEVTLTGSTTVLPIAQNAAESFMQIHEDISVSVRGGGSGVGIAALIDGRADIGNASRPIKKDEIKAAKKKGVDVESHVIAKDGIAMVVNKENPVDNLTLEQLKKIYNGKITNWKDVGGFDKKIVVVSRDYSSGTFGVFKELVLRGGKVKNSALMLGSNKAILTTIPNSPGAIGYIGLGYLSDKVKALKVDGVQPTAKNVKKGTYVLSRPLFMYTDGEPKGAVKKFIDFVLSKQGQKIVKKIDYIPVK